MNPNLTDEQWNTLKDRAVTLSLIFGAISAGAIVFKNIAEAIKKSAEAKKAVREEIKASNEETQKTNEAP